MIEKEPQVEQYTQKKKPQRRPVSTSTRRRSTLLYLGKYGLDQPNWHSTDEDASLHSAPSPIIRYDSPSYDSFAPNPQTIADIPVKRPASFRNSAQTSDLQKRPSRLIKPETISTINQTSMPIEFKKLHRFISKYASKLYLEGYLHIRHDLNSDGSSVESKNWKLHFVELSGPVLTVWDVEQEGDVIPRYINITDATVTVQDILTSDTRENVFLLNSAGANRILFEAPDPHALQDWILGIRLSCFECARIQEIYTYQFITRPMLKHLLSQQNLTKSGFLQVRFPGTTGWQKFWAVVTNHKVEKRLFNKRIVPVDPKIMFFESKKSKYPIMTFEQVTQAYTVYPESPKLVPLATLFKIEGALYKSKLVHASALVMAQDTDDMVQWLLALYDVFHLYGRPQGLMDDPQDPRALNFGDANPLMLSLQDVSEVNTTSNLTLTKKEFSDILLNKTSHPDENNSSPSLSSTTSSSATSVSEEFPKPHVSKPTQLRSMTLASDSDDDASLYEFGSAPDPNNERILSKSSSEASGKSFLPPVIDTTSQFSINVMSEVKRKQLEKQWEEEEKIAETYKLQQDFLLSQQDRANKKIEHRAKSTGQPYVKLSTAQKQSRTRSVDTIDNRTRSLSVDERYMREQKQQLFMQQQYMQQQYHGMMPVMVPVMDPRMMMTPQPIMMYDPRTFMLQQPYYPSNHTNRISRQQQQQHIIQDNHRQSAFRKSAMMSSSQSLSSNPKYHRKQ